MPRHATAPARVLFAHNSSEIGGGNRVLLGLIDHLARERFTPLSLVPRPGPLVTELRRRGVRVVRVDTLPSRRRSKASQALALFEVAVALGWRGIDLLHANGPLSYRLPALALPGAARLCHLHQPAARDAMRWAFRRRPPGLVLACSEAARERASADLDGPSPAPPVETLANAVDLDHWSSPNPAALPALPDHDALVLFCGSLGEHKGIEDYLRLAAGVLERRPRSLFVVAGDDLVGAGAYRRRMEELARSSGLGDRVRFTGFLEDPRALVHAASVVVLPSSLEGMPMALLEAAACGKPVIAYRIPGVDEVVVDGVNGRLLPAGDVGAITTATLELLADPGQAAAMGRRGRQRVETGHSATRYAERMAEHYDRLLGVVPDARTAVAAREGGSSRR